ncbi:MAG: hypothetical protein ACK5M7_03075 [Draconibacterium sp.]
MKVVACNWVIYRRKEIHYVFDYERFARDLFMTDYWFEDGYVFRHS